MKQMQLMVRCYCKKTSAWPGVKFKYKPMQDKETEALKESKAKIVCSNNSNLLEAKTTPKLQASKFNFVSADLMNTPLLQNSKYKDFEIIYGVYPVLLALQAKRRTFYNFYYKKEVLEKHEVVNEIYHLCVSYGIPTHCVPKTFFRKLLNVDSVHQGVCLEASFLSFATFDYLQIANIHSDTKNKLWLYLDQICDPMNLGAILRSSYFLGVEKVFSSIKNSCPITSVVSKASAGVAEVFPVFQIENEDKFIASLKVVKWHIISATTSPQVTPVDVDKFHPTRNVLLIVGNEGKGISKKLESLSDTFITIPPHINCISSLESLNVSVATSILVHSLLSKLKSVKND